MATETAHQEESIGYQQRRNLVMVIIGLAFLLWMLGHVHAERVLLLVLLEPFFEAQRAQLADMAAAMQAAPAGTGVGERPAELPAGPLLVFWLVISAVAIALARWVGRTSRGDDEAVGPAGEGEPNLSS